MAGLQDLIPFSVLSKQSIKKNEGYDPNIYNDTKKIATTGYGFNTEEAHVKKLLPKDVLDKKRGLTPEESDSIFESLYSTATKDAMDFVTPEIFGQLPLEAKQVVVDMSYQLGGPRLRGFEEMQKALKSGDMETARKELLNSKYATQDTPNRALRNANLLSPQQNISSLSTILNKGK